MEEKEKDPYSFSAPWPNERATFSPLTPALLALKS